MANSQVDINITDKPVLIIFFVIQFFFMLPFQPLWADGGAYLVGPRDILTLKISAGGEDQVNVDLTVSSRGMINIPFIGEVKAEGLTIPHLTTLIKKPLAKDYFENPDVNIQVKEYHSLQYHISGAVSKPGMYEMTTKVTLMELIARAGGVLPERGNVAYILRSPAGGASADEPEKINLKSLLDQGDMRHNPVLLSGDSVYIPLESMLHVAESKIYVEGEVKRPGIYEYQPGLTALNACIMAGGFDKFAAPNRARIIRKNKEKMEIIKINLDTVKKGEVRDIELMPGDMIHIPETWL